MVKIPAGNYLTLTELSERLGVSRQRAHKLCLAYSLTVIAIGSPKLLLVDERQVYKIPARRPPGKKISARKAKPRN